MAEKLGVYICEGCDIGKSLNVDELVDYAKKSKLANITPVVKKCPVLCSPEGKAEIEADIAASGLDGVVLCACSPRVKWDIFQFGGVQVERVNLREHCVWSFEDDPKLPGQLPLIAKDYVRMGMMRLSKSRVPAPELPETHQTIMVLGGGFTGLNAALEAAKLGRDVVIVERSGALGGKAATMYKSFPLSAPFNKAEDTGITGLIEAVNANPKIKVLLNAELKSLHGAPGLYTATVNDQPLEIGAVVLATGWVPGDKSFLAPMGYGSIKNVVTASEFEAMVKQGEIKRPSDGKAPASVAILTDVRLCTKTVEEAPEAACAEGEAVAAPAAEAEVNPYPDKESAKHLAYSSEITSLVALKHAGYVREKLPNALAYVLYDHMMVPGINERYYKAAQDEAGIMLSKATITGVKADADGGVIISAKDTLLGPDVEIKADLVVLPTAVVPTTAHEPTMNFEYRQGPGFPDLEVFDGFADSNYVCFPYETRRTGVYAAGCVRQPMTMATAREDAAGAVLKAVQCISSAKIGRAHGDSPTRCSTSSAAPSASAAPRNAPSAPWTTTRRARRSRIRRAAAAAAPAWAPAPSASSASTPTMSTRSARPSKRSTCRTTWWRADRASSCCAARTTPTPRSTWPPSAARSGARSSASFPCAASVPSTPFGWPTPSARAWTA